jgi:PAS domain S-box-containing protein
VPERVPSDELPHILGAVAEGITVQDVAGRLVYANDAAARMSGYPDAEALLAASTGEILSRFELLTEDGRPFPPEHLPGRRALSGEPAPEAFVGFHDTSSGQERWAVVRATPIPDATGQVTLAVNVIRDVTERKRTGDAARFLAAAGAALAESLDYRVTLQRVADLAVPTLADWCMVDVVEAGGIERVAMAHADPNKVEAMERLQRQYPDDPSATYGVPNVIRTGRSELATEISDAMLEASARDAEHLRLLRELQLRSYIVVPLVARGRILGAVSLVGSAARRRSNAADLAVAEDLAARAALAVDNARLYREAREQAEVHARLNRALNQAIGERDEAAARLQQALRTRDEFLAAAAHDLKSPLSSIKMGAQLLYRRVASGTPTGSATMCEALVRIDQTANRAATQVDELLDLARVQMGGPLQLERKPLDLVELTRGVLAEYALGSERHELRLVAVEPELVGEWDERRLRRVIGNLVDNAIKYSPNGGLVEVSMRREADEALGSDWAVLAVRDRGVGIPAAEIERIFERFQRAGNVVGRIAGAGLGLASARYFVEAHGGAILVESQEGQGTTFSVRLPLPACL